ncbi:putative mitochondrial 2-oxoglutarate/malate carrier protein [Naganishia vaughanmartiniae]|uniref:Mitochondrial 2-oxoglutarate/malate carrier protein n=1 Tax=Naganishia vaughanmartiniae TaxID=1424756 RepID=A0ACC2X7I5_9TREE|nr:putative mitochondrial 2-oxoglutarate/malate carrier protein [Naganishia vaughanmartiniae]
MSAGIASQSAGAASRAGSTSSGAANAGKAGVTGLLATPAMVAALPFINGGISGMVATGVIQPIDMVKVRLQLANNAAPGSVRPSAFSIARSMTVPEMYTGLSAGLLRQAVYTTARLGFFDTFMGTLTKRAHDAGKPVGFAERAVAGLGAGGLAAVLGNPCDLALIRMQSDGLKPVAERANYRSVIHALSSIAKSEGVLSLWTGSAPTVARAMALNFGQLAFFSEAKSQLKEMEKQGWHSMGVRTQTLAASAAAGFFASFFSLPFDFVKTRMQQHSKTAGGQKIGMAGMFAKVAREEGIFRFYRGFTTYYVRIAPHAMVTLLVADYLGFLTK